MSFTYRYYRVSYRLNGKERLVKRFKTRKTPSDFLSHISVYIDDENARNLKIEEISVNYEEI